MRNKDKLAPVSLGVLVLQVDAEETTLQRVDEDDVAVGITHLSERGCGEGWGRGGGNATDTSSSERRRDCVMSGCR